MTGWRTALTAIVAGFILGCAARDHKITGHVTRDGKPVDGGIVVMEPRPGSGTKGPGGGANLVGGRFEFEGEMRLPTGSYVLRVLPPSPRIPEGPGDIVPAQPPPWSANVEVGPGKTHFELDVSRPAVE